MRLTARAPAPASVSGNGSGATVVALEATSAPRPNDVLIPPSEVAKATKVDLLVRADEVARQAGSAITQVSARYADSQRRILVANSDGVLAGLKLIGFAVWERRSGGGRSVTFPARQYSVNGERRSFALLRPIEDVAAQTHIRDLILEAYAELEASAA